MNEIHIIGDYYLKSDSYQWIISVKTGEDKEGKTLWKNISFYPSPHQAIVGLGRKLARDNNCNTLGELLTKTDNAATVLSRALYEAEQIDSNINMEETG